MTRRYIDADALQARLERKKAGIANQRYTEGWNDCMMRVKSMVSKSSTINVAPVVHGHWIRPHWKNSNYCCDCSECGGEAMHKDYYWDKNGVYPICPNCGARMDGGNCDAAN